MADNSKNEDEKSAQEVAEVEEVGKDQSAEVESENEDENEEVAEGTVASSSAAKKKKSKRKRVKNAIMGTSAEASSSASVAKDDSNDQFSKLLGGLSKGQLAEILKMNPGLAQQLQGAGGGGLSEKELAAAMKKMSVEDIMTGLASSGKNVKDMASYKFWQTQPVPKFGDTSKIEEGEDSVTAFVSVVRKQCG
jgi:glycylpeptide N-tetradecanoyltransferase